LLDLLGALWEFGLHSQRERLTRLARASHVVDQSRTSEGRGKSVLPIFVDRDAPLKWIGYGGGAIESELKRH
jgi:hypothetical protein